MAKIAFNVKYRPQIESGEYKVETRDGRPARIICWDMKSLDGYSIIAIVNNGTSELAYGFPNTGKFANSGKNHIADLFIITPEPELTEFEEQLLSWMSDDSAGEIPMKKMKAAVCKRSQILLDLARKQFIKEAEEKAANEGYGIDGLYIALDILQTTLGKVAGYQSDDGILEHKCAISAVKELYEQKPAEDGSRTKIISRATTEKQVVLISESNGNAEIGWDTRSLEDTKKLLEFGIAFINKQLGTKPAEWSEEDKEMVRRAIFYTEHYRTNYGDTKESEECFNWLLDLHKNIRPPFHWKPSEEQMKALENVIKYELCAGLHARAGILQTLYDDLKSYFSL